MREEALANASCQQADFTALPFPAGTSDVVVAANVLRLVATVELHGFDVTRTELAPGLLPIALMEALAGPMEPRINEDALAAGGLAGGGNVRADR